jgi:hypothetical protein
MFMGDWLKTNPPYVVSLKAVAESFKILDTLNLTGLVKEQTKLAGLTTIGGD